MDRPTMKDIARASGVSQPTVSLILSGNGERYNEKTRARVMAAAKRLNYRPNLAARGLQARKTFLFGVLLNAVNHELLPEFSRGIQDVAAANHYAPVVLTHSGREEEAACLERCLERRVDGVIINAAVDVRGDVNAREHARLLVDSGVPVIEVFGHFIPGAPSVVIDAHQNGRNAVRLLHERGHQRIALYVVDLALHQAQKPTGFYWAAAEYCRGFTVMAEELAIKAAVVPYSLGADAGNHPGAAARGAFASAADVFGHPIAPTAIVCTGVEAAQALSIYASIHRDGVCQDQTLLTYGPIMPWHQAFAATITLQYPIYNMGRCAAEMLLARIAGRAPQSAAFPSVATTETSAVDQAKPAI